jgi:hypothetical protein
MNQYFGTSDAAVSLLYREIPGGYIEPYFARKVHKVMAELN